MEDLSIEDYKQLLNFYKQKVSDLELSNLTWQIRYNKTISQQTIADSATKTTKTKI
jgi:hypothetical protein